MNDMYHEVRENLRRQHVRNTQEIQGKQVDNFAKYGYYEYDALIEGDRGNTLESKELKGKLCLLLLAILLFSCYLYGGQDFVKGASLAFEEMQTTIHHLEEQEPVVRETMVYVRKAYHTAKDYFSPNQEENIGDRNYDKISTFR